MNRRAAIAAILLFTAGSLVAATGNRKATENAKSPSAETSIMVGGKKVTVEYNAPSARGRKVEGGLIPYDNWWRAGADNATTLTTETNLKIGDLDVPAGAYTLVVIASEGDWKLAVNKQTGQWGTEYDKSKDLGRVTLTKGALSTPVETLKIDLKRAPGGADLHIIWGSTDASVHLAAAK